MRSKPSPTSIAADERGSLHSGIASVEERASQFRTDFEPVLKAGHKWDAILLGLAQQMQEDLKNLDIGRIASIAEYYLSTYGIVSTVLEALSRKTIAYDGRSLRGPAGEKKEEAA